MQIGWTTYGDEPDLWYIGAEGVNPDLCVGGTAYGRASGAWKSAPIEVVENNSRGRLRVTIPASILPNGTEGEFYIVFDMGGSTIRAPETGSLSVRVYR